MSDRYILGIDTSNYKTSIAVVDRNKSIICDERRFLKVKQGEKGLRQSDALFQHVKNLPELLESVKGSFSGGPAAVAYSSKPRPVEGSYMPVFLAGESFARSIAAAIGIPALAFSHQEGHIEAIRAYSNLWEEECFLACHFSGGTSELLSVHAKDGADSMGETGKYGYEIDIIGGSKDIAFGQVIDRAGVLLGMKFPSGEEMDHIAETTDSSGKLLTGIKVNDAWLNLSGIDAQIKRLLSENLQNDIIENTYERDMLIRELFEKLSDAMEKMILQGAEKTGIDKVIMAGGVTSSAFIRKRLTQALTGAGIHIEFDDRNLSQDNAVGIALLGGKSIWR